MKNRISKELDSLYPYYQPSWDKHPTYSEYMIKMMNEMKKEIEKEKIKRLIDEINKNYPDDDEPWRSL